MIPSIPNFSGGSLPGGFSGPAAGWNGEGALPFSKLLDRTEPEQTDADEAGEQKADEATESSGEKPESPPTGPTTITLPNGETVTAGSPQLAAAIKAAVGGTPIAQAFHQQGITIPAPGTVVTDPIDPLRVIPGDIGILSDRHALALGQGKALLDGQIQHIATVSGPSFLGWEHPPANQGPAAPTSPTPTPRAGQDRPTDPNPAGGNVDHGRLNRRQRMADRIHVVPAQLREAAVHHDQTSDLLADRAVITPRDSGQPGLTRADLR